MADTAALAACGNYIPKRPRDGLEVYYRYWDDQTIFSNGKTEAKIHVDKDATYPGRDIITKSLLRYNNSWGAGMPTN